MFDHVGIPVSDFMRSKGFYLKVLTPLGYGLVLEVASEETGGDSHAGFGVKGKPQFWIGSGKPIKGQVHRPGLP
jgi:catechol 2,3-dioxygenase-like lactoylglutathione lyase family enzyme